MDNRIWNTEEHVTFNTLLSIVGFKYICFKLNKSKSQFDLLYFMTTRYAVGEINESTCFVESTHSRYKVRPTKKLEEEIINFLITNDIEEDRPNGEEWKDKGKEGKGDPEYQYFKIEKFKTLLVDNLFQKMNNQEDLIYETGHSLVMFLKKDIVDLNGTRKNIILIPMNEEEQALYKKAQEQKDLENEEQEKYDRKHSNPNSWMDNEDDYWNID